MRGQTHTSSWVLLGYFLALPVLFGVHTAEHDHVVCGDHGQNETIVQVDTECSLCDLFLSQITVFESSTSYQFFSEELTIQIDNYQIVENIIKGSNLQRGPPSDKYL